MSVSKGESSSSSRSLSSGTDIIAGDLQRIAVRVPPFYPEKPALWFAQLESQFILSGITTDATKFYYAIAQLDAVYASEVEDIITAPAGPDKYERLKKELVKRLSESRERKVKQLLNHEELGDRKPSQFLRHLKHLAGPGVPDDFLRTLWTSRLPSSTQTIVASQIKSSLEELAELADKIHDVASPSPQVSATSRTTASSASWENQIAELTHQVQALSSKLDRLSRNRSRSASRGRTRNRKRSSPSRSQSNYEKSPYCWYHTKFGPKANKCIKPCDYKGNGSGGW